MDDNKELLELTKDNNRMLKQIIEYINATGRNADSENMNDFIRNIIANILSTSIYERQQYK